MPNSSTRDTLWRQWELLKMLPSRPPGITTRELTNLLVDMDLGVSKRQIERDLASLSSHFPIICNDASRPYGWYWMKGSNSEIPGLSVAEALSMRMIKETLTPILPAAFLVSLEGRFDEAERKLKTSDSKAGNAAAHWLDKVRTVPPAQPLLPPVINEDVLDTVHSSLLKQQQLSVSYQAAANQPLKEITLHPLGLIQRGSVAYLVATAFKYSDIRLYVLHRIVAAEPQQALAKIPVGFDLDDYLDTGHLQFGAGEVVQFQAMVGEGLAIILRETPLSDDQVITLIKGKQLLKATVPITWQLRWWILSQGDQIEVKAPLLLRDEIKQSLTDAINQYD